MLLASAAARKQIALAPFAPGVVFGHAGANPWFTWSIQQLQQMTSRTAAFRPPVGHHHCDSPDSLSLIVLHRRSFLSHQREVRMVK